MLFARGHWPQSEAALRRSIELAHSFNGAFPAILGGQRLALLETAQGRYDEAHGRLRELLVAAEASTNPMVIVHSPARLYATAIHNRFEAGDLDSATSYLARGFAARQAVAEHLPLGECPTCDVTLYPSAVPVYLALGDLAQAEQATRKAEETALLFRSRAWTAAAFSCRGLLGAAQKQWHAAADSFTAALQVFETLDQPYEIARTLAALADATDAMGSPSPEADALRSRADDLFTQLGAPGIPR